MSKPPHEQVESIVQALEEKGIRAAPMVEATDLAISYPEAVGELAVAVMTRFSNGGTFLDAALSYLPQGQWPELVAKALDFLESGAKKNEAAESVILYASLQCPSALHAHLDRVFHVRPNAGCYYECYPWRESGDRHLSFLRNAVQSASSEEDRRRAWRALYETRRTDALEYATSFAHLTVRADWIGGDWAKAHLHLVGFDLENQGARRICSDALYHLRFPKGFFEPNARPNWQSVHPTWRLPEPVQSVAFGGVSNGRCTLCGETLHRLLVVNPAPPDLGVTSLTRLELATCLSCLGWERQPLLYQHDHGGVPQSIGYDGPPVSPQFPVGPLREAEIGLASTPRRWFWQDWASSNSRENLSRLGGEPSWIQNAEYPSCPSCNKVMQYLCQLDSGLPTAGGGEWLWGSGGIAYGFWCDGCRTSGWLWQCT